MKKIFLLLSVAALLSSCNSNPQNVTIVYDTLDTDVDSNNFQLVSTSVTEFEGTLPCGTCTGIQTQLSLNADSLTYEIKEIYKGKNDSAFTTRGKYDRSLSEKDAIVIYTLKTDNPEGTRYFKESGDTAIRMIDKMQKEIVGNGNYFLMKK